MGSSADRLLHRRFLRDFQAGGNLDLFLVAAVSSVLLIRSYLAATGYPKIGGEQLHIAHLLWGGLLMIVALVLALSYLDRSTHTLAAALGGLGFGTFIDEVGKFVTHDHDYFFRPAPAIIYAVFVLLYLVVRSVHRERLATREEYLANALRETQEIVLGDLSEEERDRALRYLEQSGSTGPLAEGLRNLLREAELVAEEPGLTARWYARAIEAYRRITALKWFSAMLVAFFVLQLLVKLVHVSALLDLDLYTWFEHLPSQLGVLPGDREGGIVDVALLGSSIVTALFVAAGVWRLRRSRLASYRMFHRSILVTILFGQIFLFYRDQWAALFGLGFNLLLFAALRFMITRESSEAHSQDHARRLS